MALVKKIRTSSGDLEIDYNALANKPTISSLGGVAKTGDTMTGNLVINTSGTSSALGLQAPNNSEGKQAYARVLKNTTATADFGLQLLDYAHGGNDTGNSSKLVICSNESALANKIYFTNEVNGTKTNYKLYGEHNKPTLSVLGVTATASELNKLDGLTATTDELNYCDGVTSSIQTQLNGKAASSHNHAASNITSGTLSSDRLPVVPIEKGGTGATTVKGIRTNLGGLGDVYRSNPAQDMSVASGETPVTLASLNLPKGCYIVTGNHVWSNYTVGAIYDDSIRVDDSRIFCYVRNLMDNGGGAACCAVIQLDQDTTILYTTRQLTGKAHSVHDVHFYAIKIKDTIN